MKGIRHGARRQHPDIGRQKDVERGRVFFGRQSALRLKVRDLTGGVHARVRPSAAGDAHSLSRQGKDGFVQFFLYRGGVFLYLPARIVRPVVGNFQGDLHNSTAPAISPPISTAATKSRQVSLSFLYFVLFLLPA